jgi:hypothetical protein
MLLYNVTVGIDRDVETEWLGWMKTEHIPRIMGTGYFQHYTIYKVLHDQDDGSISYSVQYFAKTLTDVMTYFERFAAGFQEELRARFPDKHVAFMTLLEEV